MCIPETTANKLRILLGNDREQIDSWLMSYNAHLGDIPFFMIERGGGDKVEAYLDRMVNQ